MLVMEELKKTNTELETFFTSSQFQLNVSLTPQSKIQIIVHVEKVVHSEGSKKRKNTMTTKADRDQKGDEEGGSSQSSQREVAPMPDPIPIKVPSTKATCLRGRKLLFS